MTLVIIITDSWDVAVDVVVIIVALAGTLRQDFDFS